MAPVNGNLAYTKISTAGGLGTGFSYTFGNFQAEMLLENSGTLAVGYVTFAPAPVDGQRQCVFTLGAVTAFYPTANTGQTVNNAVTAMSAAGRVCYTYSIANTSWDRSQ